MLKRNALRLARWLHGLFEASLLIKGLLAASEAVSGLGLLLTPNSMIQNFVDWMTRNELTQEPSDAMAQWFSHLAQSLSIQTQHFYALYLMGHGFLKLIMVLLLQKRVIWAYPASMLVLAGFVMYQLDQWTDGHSPVLLMLSGFDTFMILLVWREWRVLRLSNATA
ncbi:MAG: DUF2127 domain-containing protein [Cypionkella sp.]